MRERRGSAPPGAGAPWEEVLRACCGSWGGATAGGSRKTLLLLLGGCSSPAPSLANRPGDTHLVTTDLICSRAIPT